MLSTLTIYVHSMHHIKPKHLCLTQYYFIRVIANLKLKMGTAHRPFPHSFIALRMQADILKIHGMLPSGENLPRTQSKPVLPRWHSPE